MLLYVLWLYKYEKEVDVGHLFDVLTLYLFAVVQFDDCFWSSHAVQ